MKATKKTKDMKTKCPMCGEKDSTVYEVYNSTGYVEREVHVCQPCPCVWFDYYSLEDLFTLYEVLE